MNTLKRNFQKTLLLALSFQFILSCQNIQQDATKTSSPSATVLQSTEPLAFKGYELYSWKSEGKLYFALLLGTNRNKVSSELIKDKIENLSDLKNKLATLSKGEQIFWTSSGKMEEITFESPDKSIVDEIMNLAKEKEITITKY